MSNNYASWSVSCVTAVSCVLYAITEFSVFIDGRLLFLLKLRLVNTDLRPSSGLNPHNSFYLSAINFGPSGTLLKTSLVNMEGFDLITSSYVPQFHNRRRRERRHMSTGSSWWFVSFVTEVFINFKKSSHPCWGYNFRLPLCIFKNSSKCPLRKHENNAPRLLCKEEQTMFRVSI